MLRIKWGQLTIIYNLLKNRGRPNVQWKRQLSQWKAFRNYLTTSLDKQPGLIYNSIVMELSKYSKIFKALSNEQRLKIFMMIYRQCCSSADSAEAQAGGFTYSPCCAEGIERAFSMVCDCLNLSRSTISHHFKELQNAGLISCEREGQTFRCRINEEVIKAIKEFPG